MTFWRKDLYIYKVKLAKRMTGTEINALLNDAFEGWLILNMIGKVNLEVASTTNLHPCLVDGIKSIELKQIPEIL